MSAGGEGRAYIDRPGLRVYHGDALTVLRQLPDASVHCCVTSPPYYGLRRYLPVDDPNAPLEIGREPTPAAFVARLVEVFAEVRRVLRDDGTCWIVVGDSYAASPGKGDNVPQTKWPVHGYPAAAAHRNGSAGIPAKNLLLIPQRLAIALQDDGWIVRSLIIWSKRSAMPESVRDRPTTSHEYMLMLAKRERYFYDALAVAEPLARPDVGEHATPARFGGSMKHAGYGTRRHSGRQYLGTPTGTRNARTVWEINPQPFSAARLGLVGVDHYAAYPPKLVRRVLACATSEHGCCAACGAPYERVTETSRTFESGSGRAGTMPAGKHGSGLQGGGETLDVRRGPTLHTATTGWRPTCRCDDPRPPIPATVLDCFVGSGTTAKVATSMGRACVGIELSRAYLDIIEQRTAQMGIADTEQEAS